jgi:hypothetical protein
MPDLPKKDYRTLTRPDPVVHSGNPASYRQINAAADFPRPYSPLVTLSKNSPSGSLCLSSKKTTVVLALLWQKYDF